MKNSDEQLYTDIKQAIKESLQLEGIAFVDDTSYHRLVNACRSQVSRMRGKYTQDQLKQIIRYELGLILMS